MTAPNTLPAWSVSGKLCWLAPSHRMEAVYFTQAKREGGPGEEADTSWGSQVLGQGLLAAFPQPSPAQGKGPARAGAEKLAWPFPIPALACSSRVWQQPPATEAEHMCPQRLPS